MPESVPGRTEVAPKREEPPHRAALPKVSGGDLLSHPVARAVPSALEGLTSGFGMGPGVSPPPWPPKRCLGSAGIRWLKGASSEQSPEHDSEREQKPSPRPISTGRLNTLPCFHLRPIDLVVHEGPYRVNPVGDLILRRASHLDAFSAYLCRTWLPSRAAGATTGTPEVRPPRSSRTRGSSPQVSCAHGG